MNNKEDKIQYIAFKAFIRNKEGKILIVQESDKDPEHVHYLKWDVPGGRMKFGEIPQVSLVREVKEEVGLDISVIRPFTVHQWQVKIKDKQAQIVAVYFISQSLSDEVKLSFEHQDFKWIEPNQYNQFDLIRGLDKIFKKYLDEK